MSLAEIEEAVKTLTPEELAKLAAFIARQDNLAWDAKIERDFRLVANTLPAWKRSTRTLRPEIRTPAVKSHALASFWQCYNALPEQVQRLGEKNFALFESNPRHPSLGFQKEGGVHTVEVGEATARSRGSATATSTGSGWARTRNTIGSGSKSKGTVALAHKAFGVSYRLQANSPAPSR